MESLPSAIVDFIHLLRPLFRVEVFTSFGYLMLGILIGEATYGTARASVFAGSDSWPQRLSDLFCRHKLSHQAFMAQLVEVALASPTRQACRCVSFGLRTRHMPRSPSRSGRLLSACFTGRNAWWAGRSISKAIAMCLPRTSTRRLQPRSRSGPVCS